MKLWICVVVAVFLMFYFYEGAGKSGAGTVQAGPLSGLQAAFQSEVEARHEHTEILRAVNDQRHDEAAIWLSENILLPAERRRYLKDAEVTVGLAKEAVDETSRWQTKVVPLLANRRGRAIARHETLLSTFWQVYSSSRPEAGEAEFIHAEAERLLKGLKTGKFDRIEDISKVEDDPFPAWRKEAIGIRDSYHTARVQIEGLLRAAQSLPPVPETEAHSLQFNLDDLEQRTAVQRLLPGVILMPSSGPSRADAGRQE